MVSFVCSARSYDEGGGFLSDGKARVMGWGHCIYIL